MNDLETLITRLSAASLRVVLAESCTAGLGADLVARVPGASRVLWGAYIAYTVEAKIAMLGLEEDLIRRYGAVSRETACAMAQAALNRSGVDIAVAVTGLAGPEGDGTAVPVGTVWIATVLQGSEATARVFHYTGSRQAVRVAAAEDLIRELLRQLPVSAEVG